MFDWLRRLHEKVLGYVCVDRRVERAEGLVFFMIFLPVAGVGFAEGVCGFHQ
jgi:hypothetical protein